MVKRVEANNAIDAVVKNPESLCIAVTQKTGTL